jgi:hypothetical protein
MGLDLGAESYRSIIELLVSGKVTLEDVHRFNTDNYKKDGEFYFDIFNKNEVNYKRIC